VQFNDVPVAGWCKEQVGASDDEKKFLVGMVTADRNNIEASTNKAVERQLSNMMEQRKQATKAINMVAKWAGTPNFQYKVGEQVWLEVTFPIKRVN
jgi:hypothetical protein